MHGFEHGRPAAGGIVAIEAWVEIARCGDAHATGDGCAQVGDDVAEHVGDDDGVVDFRLGHEVHAARVDVMVFAGDFGIVCFADFIERAKPCVATVGEDVGFVDERDEFAWPCFGNFESEANCALDAEACGNHFLGADFLRRVDARDATVAAIEVFGVFTDADEIDVVGGFAGQRRVDAGVQFDGPKVDVLIEFEAHFEEQAALENAGLNIGMTNGTEEDRVVLFEFSKIRVVKHVAGFEIAFGTKIERSDRNVKVFRFSDRIENADCLIDYFDAGAVAGDCCDFECHDKNSVDVLLKERTA